MLVLARRLDERVIINPGADDEIVITVTDLQDGKVRLGFAASPDTVIHREEIWRQIQRTATKARV